MIERRYNKEGKGKKEIADLLGKSERTIRRKINRVITITKDYMWRDVIVYSAK